MNRKTIFNIHFYLTSFFTPFLFLMAVTGTCYLLGKKGSSTSKLVREGIILSSDKKGQIKNLMNEIDPSYKYEYLKDRGSSIQTRPTTRDYYNLKQVEDGSFQIYKVKPSFLLRLIEVHKGHGPGLLKYFQIILGIGLSLIILSGLMLSIQMRNRVKSFWITSGTGALFLIILFLL